MTLRRTLLWLALFVIVSVAGVGGYVYWKVAGINETIRERLLAEIAEKAPNWIVSVDRVRFDWNRTLHVHGFTLRPRGDTEELATVPEVRISIDRASYDRDESVIVQRVHLVKPSVRLERETDGRWNWQRLLPMASDERTSLPEWVVEGADIRILLRHSEASEPVEVAVARSDGRIVPSGKRRFRVLGNLGLAGTGTFDLDGALDVDRTQWSFSGRARDLVSGERLVELATRAAPEVETRIAEFDAQLQGWLPEAPGAPEGVRYADASADGTPARTVGTTRRTDPPALGLDGRMTLAFRLGQKAADAPLSFAVEASFDGAKLDHPALPFPLHDVDGRIVWANDGFRVDGFKARNGVTRVEASGALRHGVDRPARGEFRLKLSDVVLDERLRSRLTGRIRRIHDLLRPTGRADFATRIVVDERGPHPEDLLLVAKNAKGAFAQFPYPYERITGGVRQEGDDLIITVDGFAGDVPVRVRGRVRDFAGAGEAVVKVSGEKLPIDDRFLQACPPQARSALRSMRLTGTTDFEITATRPPGRDTKWNTRIDGTLADGSIECAAFPYRCSDLTGRLVFDSQKGTWTFSDLAARHDGARLTGNGVFTKTSPDDPGRLKLRVVAREASFDQGLRLALNDSLRRAWTMLDPSGDLDAIVDVDWSPGRPPVVALPAVRVREGRMRVAAFPLPLTDVLLDGRYADGRFDVTRYEAKRDDTRIRSTGFYLLEPGRRWRLRMEKLFVDDLAPDADFRAALPKSMRGVVESLDPRGLVSLSGRVEMRGRTDGKGVVTSAWDLDGVLPGTTISAGVELEKVRGTMTSKGTFDGTRVVAEGNLDVDSLQLLGYQFTSVKGPYEVDGARVTLGSRKAFLDTAPPIKLEERITARAIDGLFVIDGIVVTGAEPAYNLKVLLSNGRLESYAQRYMPGATNLAGVMNGWVDLHGRGTSPDDLQGRGQVQIAPAALYELPVVLKLLTAVPFARRRSAFDNALLDFRIARSRFLFDTIDLNGDALVLRGRGNVGFDRSLNLDFYSQSARRPLAIPVVGTLVGEATRGLVAVYVRGSLDQPQTEYIAAPTIDNALRGFLGPIVQPGNSAMRRAPGRP